MSLNRHSTPPGGVRNPIDSPPPRAYAPPIAPHWAIGISTPESKCVKGAHRNAPFFMHGPQVYGGAVRGSRKAGRSHLPGSANPVRSRRPRISTRRRRLLNASASEVRHV